MKFSSESKLQISSIRSIRTLSRKWVISKRLRSVWFKDSARFQRPQVDTSRPRNADESNEKYNFVTRDQIQNGIKQKEYLEHGEYNGNLYGVRFKSITDVIGQNKIVVLDVNPWVSSFYLKKVYEKYYLIEW